MGVPVKGVTHVLFNPNLYSRWFTAVTQVISNLTMLAIILTGQRSFASASRARWSTFWSCPWFPSRSCCRRSGECHRHSRRGRPVDEVCGGRVARRADCRIALLFFAGSCIFVFTVGSLGIALGTIASTMGQFGLLQLPVLLVLMLLSGATTPMESMPLWLQYLMKIAARCRLRGVCQKCALSRRGFSHRLAPDGGGRSPGRCLFRLHPAPLPPRYFRKLKHVAAVTGGPNAGGHPERRQWVMRET